LLDQRHSSAFPFSFSTNQVLQVLTLAPAPVGMTTLTGLASSQLFTPPCGWKLTEAPFLQETTLEERPLASPEYKDKVVPRPVRLKLTVQDLGAPFGYRSLEGQLALPGVITPFTFQG